MNEMFKNALLFNQNLSHWRVCKVLNSTDFDLGTTSWTSSNKPLFGNPCIVKLEFLNASSYYGLGEVLQFNIVFNENVTVTGKPYVEMELESPNKKAYYTNGSGTENLTFTYVIEENDHTHNLDHAGRFAFKIEWKFDSISE